MNNFIKKAKNQIHPSHLFIKKVKKGPLASIITDGSSISHPNPNKQSNAEFKKLISYNFHKLSFEELCSLLSTSSESGLTDEQAKNLLNLNGPNKLRPPETHYIRKIIGYFTGGFCWILWVSVIICFLAWRPIGDPPDPTNLGLAILLILVIFIQAGFEAFQDYSSTKIMKSIKKMMASDAYVIRNGLQIKILSSELVVGDLVVLNYGQIVPADIRIIESSELKFDRAMLTGESDAVDGTAYCTNDNYTESKNIAFMATLITNGTGKGVVTLTGENTMIGSIAALTAGAKTEKTTLQMEIRKFVTLIAILSITTVVICFIVWGVWLRRAYPNYISVSSMLVNAIAILVAFIPTGLPVPVTLSLLLIAKRMARNKVLVKNLTVIETLSCVNVIASDKTGTLTQNKMFVANSASGLTVINSGRARRASVMSETGETHLKSSLQLLNAIILCNEAKYKDDEKHKPITERGVIGGATDIAMLNYGANILEIDDVMVNYKTIAGLPFNSRNKWMARIFKLNKDRKKHDCFDMNDSKEECVVIIKGAPDILIKKCKYMVQDSGSQKDLTEFDKKEIMGLQDKWCLLGQRVLMICKRLINESDLAFKEPANLETYLQGLNDFCYLGMIGIVDKPREGIDSVIRTLRSAGIRILMVTGDFSVTAAAIATQIRLFSSISYDTINELKEKSMRTKDKQKPSSDNSFFKKIFNKNRQRSSIFIKDPLFKSLLLTGGDLEILSDSEWKTVTKYEEIVIARATPAEKLKVVEKFKQEKNIVGVTGDGVNDSPALKAANIGIAMGGGSEVAMEAAQMVLLDNSFNSMIVAIENGRLLFYNLRKVILYLLPAGSFAEIIPIILNIYFGVPLPLSAFQMICICVLTDLGPSLSMMLEKSEGDLLKKPPRVIGKDHLVDYKLLLFAYFFLGVFESFFSILMYFVYMFVYGKIKPNEIFFAFDKWKDGYLGKDQKTLDNLVHTGQTVTFVTLVIIQTFGNVFITRTRRLSLFQSLPFMKPHRNLWLFLAQAISIILMFVVIFVPFFNQVFHTNQIPIEFYFIPLGFCVVFITLDEIRKLFVRRKVKFFVKTAW